MGLWKDIEDVFWRPSQSGLAAGHHDGAFYEDGMFHHLTDHLVIGEGRVIELKFDA